MEKQLKRSEVPQELKWDLTLLYKSDDAMETALQETEKKSGSLGQNCRQLCQ